MKYSCLRQKYLVYTSWALICMYVSTTCKLPGRKYRLSTNAIHAMGLVVRQHFMMHHNIYFLKNIVTLSILFCRATRNMQTICSKEIWVTFPCTFCVRHSAPKRLLWKTHADWRNISPLALCFGDYVATAVKNNSMVGGIYCILSYHASNTSGHNGTLYSLHTTFGILVEICAILMSRGFIAGFPGTTVALFAFVSAIE